MGKYDDYWMGAIGMEGSNNWPSQWTEECDESFKEYKKQIDAGKKVDENSFLDKQKFIFSKMSQADKDRCYVYKAKVSWKTPKKSKKSAWKTPRRTPWPKKRLNSRRLRFHK